MFIAYFSRHKNPTAKKRQRQNRKTTRQLSNTPLGRWPGEFVGVSVLDVPGRPRTLEIRVSHRRGAKKNNQNRSKIDHCVFDACASRSEGFRGSILEAPERRQNPENSNIAWEGLRKSRTFMKNQPKSTLIVFSHTFSTVTCDRIEPNLP